MLAGRDYISWQLAPAGAGRRSAMLRSPLAAGLAIRNNNKKTMSSNKNDTMNSSNNACPRVWGVWGLALVGFSVTSRFRGAGCGD